MKKICSKCKEEKDLSEFYKHKKNKDGYWYACKACKAGRSKKYREKNKESIRVKKKKYREDNLEIISKKNKAYKKEKWGVTRKDPVLYLAHKYRFLVWYAYNRLGTKKEDRASNILGCTYTEFKDYLNNNSYGLTCGDKDVDIDHVQALSTAKTIEDVKRLSHYTNFQLLPSEYNRHIKVDKEWDKDHFENWLNN